MKTLHARYGFHKRLGVAVNFSGTPLNRLIDDMVSVMLAKFDAETRLFLPTTERFRSAMWLLR